MRWRLWKEDRTFSMLCCSERSVSREWKGRTLPLTRFFFRFLSFVHGIAIPVRLPDLKPRMLLWFKLLPHSIHLQLDYFYSGKLRNVLSICTANTVSDIAVFFYLIQRPFFFLLLLWQIGTDVPWLHSDILEDIWSYKLVIAQPHGSMNWLLC